MYQHMLAVRDRSCAKGAARAIMYALASRANEDGEAWPSSETLARDAGISARTVKRILPQLEAIGEIAVNRAAREKWTSGGTQRVNIYRLLVPTGSDVESLPSCRKSPKGKVKGGDSLSPKGVTACPKGGDTVSPEVKREVNPIKETLKETESHIHSDVRGLVFFHLIDQAIEIANDKSKKQKAYLGAVLDDWIEIDGEDDAYKRFQKCLNTVVKQRDRGRINGNITAYFNASLRQARESWDAGYENRQHYLANEGDEPKYTGG